MNNIRIGSQVWINECKQYGCVTQISPTNGNVGVRQYYPWGYTFSWFSEDDVIPVEDLTESPEPKTLEAFLEEHGYRWVRVVVGKKSQTILVDAQGVRVPGTTLDAFRIDFFQSIKSPLEEGTLDVLLDSLGWKALRY